MRADLPSIEVFDVSIAMINRTQALREVKALLEDDGPALLAYVNAHSLNLARQQPGYRDVLRRADLVLADGSGMALAGWAHRCPFPDNLNGTDFTPRLLAVAAALGAPVFLLGGPPGVAQDAAIRLTAAIPGLTVVGAHHGYLTREETSALTEQIRHTGAQVVLAGMGNPLQELWLDKHLAETGARLGVAVGAFLDFAAGRVPRAPGWMRALGFEWAFRLLREPRRLFRRYVLGNPLFVYRVLREVWARHKHASAFRGVRRG